MDKVDAELFEAGRRFRGRGQCAGLIVATDSAGERNYHQCSADSGHPARVWHYCGCGQEWDHFRGEVRGPLSDVVFS